MPKRKSSAVEDADAVPRRSSRHRPSSSSETRERVPAKPATSEGAKAKTTRKSTPKVQKKVSEKKVTAPGPANDTVSLLKLPTPSLANLADVVY